MLRTSGEGSRLNRLIATTFILIPCSEKTVIFLMAFVRGELYYIKISKRGAENEHGLMDVQDLENKLSDVFSSTATIHAVYVQREDSLRLDYNWRLFEFFYSNECHVMKIVDRFRGESVILAAKGTR